MGQNDSTSSKLWKEIEGNVELKVTSVPEKNLHKRTINILEADIGVTV
jgi:hypothetical protein